MQGHLLLRTLAVLAVLTLFAPSAPFPSASADDAPAPPPFRPLPGLEGPRATLRLYGCGDVLEAAPEPTVATRFHSAEPAPGAPDGRLDCVGDRLHLGNAFLASAAEPAHRLALGPRDQTLSVSLRHLPAAWFPGPGHPGGVSDLVDPTIGFFDVDADGALDLAPPTGAARGPDGSATAADQTPRDGRPDHALRGSGVGEDRYFPALEARYDLVWTAGSNTPVPVPAKGAFLLPVHAEGARPGIHDWGPEGKLPVHWHPTPFDLGTRDDGVGALHTDDLTLEAGDEVWFLDHGLRVTGFFGSPESPRVGLEVLYNGAGAREVLEGSLILSPEPTDASRHATLDHRAGNPINAVFADRTGIDRNVPPFEDHPAATSDAAWFALVSGIRLDDAGDEVTLRMGRVVAKEAPWNAFVADRLFYRFDAVDERAGALHRLGLTSLHPLESSAQVPSAALTLEGLTRDDAFPFLPPFDRDHTATADLSPGVERTEGGFLAGTGTGPVSADALALRADARTPAERAQQRGPLGLQWRTLGQEDRFVVPVVDLASDDRLTVSALLPSRFVELVLPDGRYRVDSVLLDDTAVLTGATEDPATPRGHRSFLFDPQTARPLFSGPNGLRLAGGTNARPDGGDLVRFDPALLRWEDYGGRIRTPDRLADGSVRLSLRFEPSVGFGAEARPLPVVVGNETGLRDGTNGHHDNLWDAQPVSTGPDPAAYGPTLRAQYAFGFLDRTTLEGLAPPLGPRTGLLIPVADRDPAHPGLDSFDMVGNGEPDEVLLRGYWDLGRAGGARERLTTGGTFVGEGNASTADMVWLRSRAFTLAPGVALQFFDHGIRFEGAEVIGSEIRPHFTLLDHRGAGAPRASGTVTNTEVGETACVAVERDHTMRERAEPCADLQMSPPEAGRSPTGDDVLWWVEVEAASSEAVTLSLNRVVTSVDRDPPGDDRHLWVGGQMYAWDGFQIDGERVSGVRLSHLVPLGEPLEVTLPDDLDVHVTAVPTGEPMPLFPPFGQGYTSLQIHDVAVERGPEGFLDSRGDPGDGDAVLADRATRVEELPPLVVRFHGVHAEARHHFLFLDPVRAWDPERNGIAFVNGMWAEPWAGLARPDGMAALVTEGAGAIDEALRRGDDRGWDHHAQVTIEGPSRVVVDSGRLAAPNQTARVPDLGVGLQNGALESGPHPDDPSLVEETARGAGLWVFRLFEPTDLYIGFLEGSGRTPPPPPPPSEVPTKTPGGTVPWPSRTTDPTDTTRDGPLGLAVLFGALLVALGIVTRRRR